MNDNTQFVCMFAMWLQRQTIYETKIVFKYRYAVSIQNICICNSIKVPHADMK